MLTSSTPPEAARRFHDALERYGSENPTWWTANAAMDLVIRGGLDDSSVAPVIEQIGSPLLSAKFTMARAMRHRMDGEVRCRRRTLPNSRSSCPSRRSNA